MPEVRLKSPERRRLNQGKRFFLLSVHVPVTRGNNTVKGYYANQMCRSLPTPTAPRNRDLELDVTLAGRSDLEAALFLLGLFQEGAGRRLTVRPQVESDCLYDS